MVSHTSQIHMFILYNSGIGDVGEGGEGGVSSLIMGTKIRFQVFSFLLCNNHTKKAAAAHKSKFAHKQPYKQMNKHCSQCQHIK